MDRKITKKGVFAPEGVIDPDVFFQELDEISDLLKENEEINTDGPKFINIFRSWL